MALNTTDFEAAVHAALHGPEKKDLTIDQHSFNVKPAVIERDHEKGIITVTGDEEGDHHISHRKFGFDDQISYKFTKKIGDTSIPSIGELDIEVSTAFEKYLGLTKDIIVKTGPIILGLISGGGSDGKADAAVSDEVMEETKKLLDGEWEGELYFLITHIYLRAE